MNRRDVVKGIATLALAGTAAQGLPLCNPASPCTPATKSLLVWLEGPFAVVFNGDPVTGVTAFTPIESEHDLVVMGKLLSSYPKRHHFDLDGPGLNTLPPACISADFKAFSSDHLGLFCDPEIDSFVRISLPCPKNVWTSKLLSGTLGSNTVCIPQDHVLEYEIKDPGQATILWDEEAKKVLLPDQKNVFHIEVGLPNPPRDPMGQHAMDFHNYSLLKCFSSAQPTLTAIGGSCTCAPNIPPDIDQRLNHRSSTLECKSGGLIGGNP